MTSPSEAGFSLCQFIKNIGILEILATDGASEFTGQHTDFVCKARKMRWKQRMSKKGVPHCLWDLGLIYKSELLSHIARGHSHRSGYKEVTVTESGKLVSKISVHLVTMEEHLGDAVKWDIVTFDSALNQCLDNSNFSISYNIHLLKMDLEKISTLIDDPGEVKNEKETTPCESEYVNMVVDECPEEDEKDAIDKYLSAKLILRHRTGHKCYDRVTNQLQGFDNESTGQAHNDPLFGTQEYNIKFTEGTPACYQTNIIAENLFAQVDNEGHQYHGLAEITDYCKDAYAIHVSEGKVQSLSLIHISEPTRP
eukprot:15366514-Ditylum_brightwellii.AAC.2